MEQYSFDRLGQLMPCPDREKCGAYLLPPLPNGTPEKCRAAVERQKAVDAMKINNGHFEYQCPKCNFKLEIGYRHCVSCGQLLKYSD